MRIVRTITYIILLTAVVLGINTKQGHDLNRHTDCLAPRTALTTAEFTKAFESGLREDKKFLDIIETLGIDTPLFPANEQDWNKLVSAVYVKIFPAYRVLPLADQKWLIGYLQRNSANRDFIIPKSLVNKIFRKIDRMYAEIFIELVNGVHASTIYKLKKTIKLTEEEEGYLWALFHRYNHDISNRDIDEIKEKFPEMLDYIGNAVKQNEKRPVRIWMPAAAPTAQH